MGIFIESKPELIVLKTIEKSLNIRLPVFTKQIKWNDFGVYIQNEKILGIGFYSQKFDIIPEEIWSLKHLKVLNLINNGLIEISEEIGALSSLNQLYIGGNKLENIPKSIEKLENLIYFYLLENNLLKVPEEIGKLVNLKELSISSRETNTIPK